MKKSSIYLALNDDAMRNGSYYRKDHATARRAAHYMNGDYMGHVASSEIPAGLRTYSRDEAKCFPLVGCY